MALVSVFLSFVLFLCTPLPIVRGYNPDDCFNRAKVALLQNGVGCDRYGTVEFCETVDSEGYPIVLIQFDLFGLPPGQHGIHIHESGDSTQGCDTMGAHWNPYMDHHGDQKDQHRHLGDLGNLIVGSDGKANYQISDDFISLSDDVSIIGRGFVLHANQDDLGRGGNAESLKTGNSGARIACGVIGTLNDGKYVSMKKVAKARPKRV